VKKEWIIVGLVGLTMAGCGSSSSSSSGGSTASQAPATTQTPASAGHTSEWTSADTAKAEGDLNKESKGEGLSSAFKQCLIKGVEETFSPAEYTKDNAENKEAGKARGVAEACAKKYPPTSK
jgi:hypothetical protein